MIKTFAELLEKIKLAEAAKLEALGIKHRPTIGDVYEGLTASLLERLIFDNLNLNIVCNSFIKLPDGTRSPELDIIIIEGEGEKILYSTDRYDVKFEQIVAVIQVKKKINKQNIEEAYWNLKNVYDMLNVDVAEPYTFKLFRDAYISICGEDVLDRSGKRLRKTFSSGTRQQIFHMLKLESILPARIVFGYDGYASQFSFREGIIEFLQENKSEPTKLKHGFAPINFPDLIISGNFSVVKANGMPYVGAIIDDQWLFYLSSSQSAILKMIEILWTRLSYRYSLPSDIFGEDLEVEGLNIFLRGNLVNIEGIRAWNFEYTPLTKKQLAEEHTVEQWSPVLLTQDQHPIIAHLCHVGKLKKADISLLLAKGGSHVNATEFIDGLLATKLVGFEHDEVILLTENCQCVAMPDGNVYAADNKTGRLSRWIDKKLAEIRALKSSQE